MWDDVPDHFLVNVDENGNGPTEPENTVGYSCWCGRSTLYDDPYGPVDPECEGSQWGQSQNP